MPVYANDYNTPEVGRSFYTDMKYGQKFFTYIVDELPLICKSVFNISSKRKDTAIIGVSMGGYGALKCAYSKPKQYGHVCAFSPPCLFLKGGLAYQRDYGDTDEFRSMYGERLINDFEAIFGQNLEWHPKEDVSVLAREISCEGQMPSTYIACGMEDFLRIENQRFAEEMSTLEFDFTYEEWSGDHTFQFFDKALKKAMKRLYESY